MGTDHWPPRSVAKALTLWEVMTRRDPYPERILSHALIFPNVMDRQAPVCEGGWILTDVV